MATVAVLALLVALVGGVRILAPTQAAALTAQGACANLGYSYSPATGECIPAAGVGSGGGAPAWQPGEVIRIVEKAPVPCPIPTFCLNLPQDRSPGGRLDGREQVERHWPARPVRVAERGKRPAKSKGSPFKRDTPPSPDITPTERRCHTILVGILTVAAEINDALRNNERVGNAEQHPYGLSGPQMREVVNYLGFRLATGGMFQTEEPERFVFEQIPDLKSDIDLGKKLKCDEVHFGLEERLTEPVFGY